MVEQQAGHEAEPNEERGGAATLDRLLAERGMYVAMAAALVATLGSLYFSEVRLYIPCRLCWFQRIFMYPLAFLIPVGLLRRDAGLRLYVLPLAFVGGGISLYHVLMQKTSLVTESAACLTSVPCSGQYINWFGFISIPVLALTAFAVIILTASAAGGAASESDHPNPTTPWRSVAGVAAIVGAVFAALWIFKP